VDLSCRWRFLSYCICRCFVRLLNICAHVIDEATPGPPPTKPTLPSLPNPPSLSPIRRRGRGGKDKDKDDRSSPQGTLAKEKEKGSTRTSLKGLCSKRLKVCTALHGNLSLRDETHKKIKFLKIVTGLYGASTAI